MEPDKTSARRDTELRRRRRARRRRQSAQSLVIFALLSVAIFSIVGLAVDAGISYLRNTGEERAAAAAALAGVSYLPGDTTSASDAALTEAARNGYRQGDTSGGRNISVTVTPQNTNQLKVTISESVPTYFLGVLGFGRHNVLASATAVYLRPIKLGQPGDSFGSDLAHLGTGGTNYYFLRTEGYGNPRHEGDAYTPNPTIDTTYGGPDTANGVAYDLHAMSGLNATDTADASLPDRGGYNYLVYVPTGVSAGIEIFNPGFAPDTPSAGYDYHEYDGSFSPGSTNVQDYSTMKYTIFQVKNIFDYTKDTKLRSLTVAPIDARSLDNAISGTQKHSFQYFDSSGAEQTVTTDKTGGNCTGLQNWPSTFHCWVDISRFSPTTTTDKQLVSTSGSAVTLTGPGYFRVRVDTLKGSGQNPADSDTTGSKAHKGYAIRAIASAPADPQNPASCQSLSTACTLGGLNDAALFTPISAAAGTTAAFSVPLFQVPPEYAGQNLDVNIYDPGDVSGNAAYMSILKPDLTVAEATGDYDVGGALGNAKVSADLVAQTPALPPDLAGQAPTDAGYVYASLQTMNAGSVPYNGHWVHFVIHVPGSYNPAPGAEYWSLHYSVKASNGSATTAGDTITVQAGYNGTPVHLLP